MAGLSVFDPIYLGIDENGDPVYLDFVYYNLLTGGEPGAGKSGLVQNIIAHCALSTDVRLVLMDAKRVELGMWAHIADVYVGPDLDTAIAVLEWLTEEMHRRTDALVAHRLRKMVKANELDVICLVVDELAYFTASIADVKTRETLLKLLRDLVAFGRAVGICSVLATQRPSGVDVIPTTIRDIISHRCAFRCMTAASSDMILGSDWVEKGYNAQDIPEDHPGIAWLLAGKGAPRRIRCAYLSDEEIDYLAEYAAHIRGVPGWTAQAGEAGGLR